MSWKFPKILIVVLLFVTNITPLFSQVATTTDDLKNKIEERNSQIKQLEAEINQYNIEVTNAGSQAQTLQGTLKSLDLTKKKITTDISLTQAKISKANLTISQLGNGINTTKAQIDVNKLAVISALKSAQVNESVSIIEMVLSSKSIKDIWTDIDNIRQVQQVIHDKSKQLTLLEEDMKTKQSTLTNQKISLVNLQQDLGGKKQAVESTTAEQAALLIQTKNKETAFKQLVQSKQQQRAQFENEVAEFEAQLHLNIDQSSYPTPEHGILSWPLENEPTQPVCDTARKVVSCIVRGFLRAVVNNGVTLIAGHNGVDFRASTGTKVVNVLDGVVAGTGNTDIYAGCYGLGKWVMVNHPNGLSTIYMHLSVISVSKGQNLNTGDIIGFSGNTGNSEAPHLHVSVYAAQGVRIEQFVNSIGCKQAVVPLADAKAYLDPLQYFPKI